ncbi:MAG: precorrin-6y C5,15-methyltransferase (decarboxylating) subunit CbiE [Nitrospirae bacterium]|nr:precorrin-6y C5,15-methyltransferase (decarboxylating) subunit CbiE [Nitrospirota bacterium]
MTKIHLIGIGYKPLDKKATEAILRSDVILANNRLLEVFKEYSEYESVKGRVKVLGSIHETMEYLKAQKTEDRRQKTEKRSRKAPECRTPGLESKNISLLASGDPMLFGIGRLITEVFNRDAVDVYPDLSSIQVAFSRIKETWSGAFLMSVHGGPDPTKRRKLEYEIADIPHLLATHNKLAILTDRENNPSEIAKAISGSSALCPLPSALKMYVCERLGYPVEKIVEGTPEEIAVRSFEHPNVVVIINSKEHRAKGIEQRTPNSVPLIPDPQSPTPIFGLREDEILHSRGLITKNEVRSVALHKLRFPQKGVFWDIGAGSGAVSMEAARLIPALKVFAVEKDEEQINNITANKNKFNTMNIEIVKGDAPEALKGLPAPDRVFIGGSSGKLEKIIDSILTARRSSLIVVINATTIETLNEAMQCMERNHFSVDISEVSVSRSKMAGNKRHMSALNPVFIITGEKD